MRPSHVKPSKLYTLTRFNFYLRIGTITYLLLCIFTYIYTCMHIYHTYLHTYTHTYTYIHTHTHLYTYIHTYTWLSTGTESNRSARCSLAMDSVSGCEYDNCRALSMKNACQHFPVFKKVLTRPWCTKSDPSNAYIHYITLDYIRLNYVSALSYFEKTADTLLGHWGWPI